LLLTNRSVDARAGPLGPRAPYNIQRTGQRVITPSLGTGALTLLDPSGRAVTSIHVARQTHDACLG
jgi:hypothetical protein